MPVDFLANHLRVGVFGRARLQLFALHEKPRFDGGKRVSDFMGDPGC